MKKFLLLSLMFIGLCNADNKLIIGIENQIGFYPAPGYYMCNNKIESLYPLKIQIIQCERYNGTVNFIMSMYSNMDRNHLYVYEETSDDYPYLNRKYILRYNGNPLIEPIEVCFKSLSGSTDMINVVLTYDNDHIGFSKYIITPAKNLIECPHRN